MPIFNGMVQEGPNLRPSSNAENTFVSFGSAAFNSLIKLGAINSNYQANSMSRSFVNFGMPSLRSRTAIQESLPASHVQFGA